MLTRTSVQVPYRGSNITGIDVQITGITVQFTGMSGHLLLDWGSNFKRNSQLSELVEGKTEEEMGEFFDSHDLSEYEDELPEAEFEVNPKIRKSRKLTEEEKNHKDTKKNF